MSPIPPTSPRLLLPYQPFHNPTKQLQGEDPFLGKALVGPLIDGIQKNVMAISKHYILNNQVCLQTRNKRLLGSAWVRPERNGTVATQLLPLRATPLPPHSPLHLPPPP